ncbi:MAG: M56 family metallopeptidase [Oscillospiraceae bacterium]|jgi:beta-lactamase regulating signal transducer with metallopeptidase domain|nr:M56 family metallopeptidase [Oscillospiraceae bacterium]
MNIFYSVSEFISPVFYTLLFMSATALFIGIVVMALNKFTDKKISPSWKRVLWLCVLAALLIPFRPASPASVSGFIEPIKEVSYRQEYAEALNRLDRIMESNINGSTDEGEHNVNISSVQEEVNRLELKSLIFDTALPLIWLTGVIAVSLYLVIMKTRLCVLLKKNRISVPYARYYRLLKSAKKELNIKRHFRIIFQDFIKSPALIGVFNPQIVLPEYTLDMNEQDVKYAILHELSHYKRLDTVLNGLLLALYALYWFNPVILYFFKFIRQDIEMANDEYVLKSIGQEHQKSYSLALINMLGRMGKIPLTTEILCMADTSKNIERRIKMIKLNKIFTKNRLIIGSVSILLIILISLLFLTGKPQGADTAESDPDTGISEGYEPIANTDLMYGTYNLLKTLDLNDKIKVPEETVLSLKLTADNTYELVFANGNRSYGSIEELSDEILGNEVWEYSLRDDRNDYEPSYNFMLKRENDGTVCVLMIPQGVGDNSWVETADFWIFKKGSQLPPRNSPKSEENLLFRNEERTARQRGISSKESSVNTAAPTFDNTDKKESSASTSASALNSTAKEESVSNSAVPPLNTVDIAGTWVGLYGDERGFKFGSFSVEERRAYLDLIRTSPVPLLTFEFKKDGTFSQSVGTDVNDGKYEILPGGSYKLTSPDYNGNILTAFIHDNGTMTFNVDFQLVKIS